MIRCPKCNKELEDGSKFCDACGARIYETIYCPNCGEPTSTEFAFCQKCGAPITEDIEVPADSPAPAQPQEKQSHLRALPGKAIALGGIAVIAVVAVVLVVTSLLSGGNGSDYSLYFKDGEIFYTDYTEDGTIELTSRFINVDGASEISGDEWASSAYSIGSYIAFNEAGNRIFFPDRLDAYAEGITLYYRDLNKPKEEAVKIDSDVFQYAINGDGTKIVYTKGSDGILYISDLEEKEKIASGVQSFYVSDDLSKIGYLNDENSFYIWYADKDSVKLASDISSIRDVAPDLSMIYYMKDGNLYKRSESGDDSEKIASDVFSVVKIYDSGEIYYIKTDSAEKNLMDYVDDDMASTDASMTEPSYPDYPDSPDYPSWWDYDTDAEYEAALAQYEADYDAYQASYEQINADYEAAYEAYWEKINRDSLREDLENATMENNEYSLYYYDGTEETLVTDALATSWDVDYASDKPVVVFPVYNQSSFQKVKLSEITSISDVSDLVDAALYASSEMYTASGAAMSLLEQTDASNYTFSDDGATLYFLDDVSDGGDGDLYKATITDGQIGKPELFDSDVNNSWIFLTSKDEIAYYKNVDSSDDKGDLCINGEEIDYDVYLWSFQYLDDAILYYTDWNSDKQLGTLKMYDNGTKTKIADDVNSFQITNDNDIVYLYDYSTNYYTGTLYLYHKGDATKIDDDVAALIPVYDSSVRGGSY